jgi:cellulose synthase operon protein C
MDRADRAAADATGADAPDYRAAIERYEAFLKAHPGDPRTDRVLYQLARAQEGGGQIEAALATLTRLVTEHPGTLHAEEAHFRRGEMLFATQQWAGAEAAFRTVLAGGSGSGSAFTERARYMQGWSLYKQGRLDDALEPFFAVIDARLGDLPELQRDESRLDALPSLTRADRELLEDSFRIMAISLAQLQGAASIPAYVTTPQRQGWQFRAYAELAALFLRQERVKDAADTLAAFVRRQPLHAQAPQMQAQVIRIYEDAGFAQLALEAKREHVQRYDAASEFRRANPAGWARAQPLVRQHLVELARHHHALAQQVRSANPNAVNPDVGEAVRWYDALIAQFPDDAETRANRFLLAELLYDDRRFDRAADEFERVAYPVAEAAAPAAGAAAPFARAADAGYSLLLALAAQRDGLPADGREPVQRRAVAAAVRFADAFPADTRGGPVLVNASETLFGLAGPGDGDAAAVLARRALDGAAASGLSPELARVAWTVLAHQAFEATRYAEAEQGYAEVLARAEPTHPRRAEWVERQAAAIYRQGEIAREAGDLRAAVGHFARVAGVAGLAAASTLRAGAGFDRAAGLIALQDWSGAAEALEAFRREHATHPLAAEVPARLALAYLELGRHTAAALEFERVAAAATDPALARAAWWQAAELHDKAVADEPVLRPKPSTRVVRLANGRRRTVTTPAPAWPPLRLAAVSAWERYLAAWPAPLEAAMEARWRLAELTKTDSTVHAGWLRALQQADSNGGAARTPRTRALGGQATLALAAPLEQAYRAVRLVEPLKRQLAAKKARMDDLLKAYATASEAGVAEVTTAATYRTAALYADFGEALIKSERPRRLSKLEREQYDVLLEEQAFPFEEKAIELHEANARRTAQGLYDASVKASLEALAKFKPVRYAKAERHDAAYTPELAPLQKAVTEARARGAEPAPALLNALGVALRREGRFGDARLAYEEALALDATATAPLLNLAILHDLYLDEATKAEPLYRRVAELAPSEAAQVNRWLAELRSRKPAANAAAAAEAPVSDTAGSNTGTNTATSTATSTTTATAPTTAPTARETR